MLSADETVNAAGLWELPEAARPKTDERPVLGFPNDHSFVLVACAVYLICKHDGSRHCDAWMQARIGICGSNHRLRVRAGMLLSNLGAHVAEPNRKEFRGPN